MNDPLTLIAIGVGAIVVLGLSIWAFGARRRSARHAEVHARSITLGHTEPVSLHPRIDEHKCICTGACVTVCPEKEVLGMVDGKPMLIRPTACVGHGECLRACPVDAISLVIGSEKRGVDLPLLGKDFQTNVPGLYIAGELGGMGLIHNAVKQGTQAALAIADTLAKSAPRDPDVLDVLIVGAGPAGLSAALQSKELGLRFAIVDQEQLGGALRTFPRQKIVMTSPFTLPLYGKVKLGHTTKVALLEMWEEIVARTGIKLECGTKVEDIRREGDLFAVKTSRGSHRAARVLLAVGRRGTPRKLGVPGEELDKVTYSLLEPEQYRGRSCLVVGGGDMAVETALLLANEPGTTVSICHRDQAFSACKPANADRLMEAKASGRVTIFTSARVLEIAAHDVNVSVGEKPERISNDYVFVCIGGELPTKWLAKIGVDVQTFSGQAPAAFQS